MQKKAFLQLLKSGSKYEKQIQQFCLDPKDYNFENFDDVMYNKKKDILKYFKDKTQCEGFDDDQKAILDGM